MNTCVRELANRELDGLKVTTFGNAHSNQVSIALDAFHHPYAHAILTDAASNIAPAKSAQVTS
jgi:hypothetical protein